MSKVLVFTSYGGPETEQIIERPMPTPGPDQVAIEVKAAGVNPADWKTREGRFGTHHTLPKEMGFEASGIVRAVGDNVSGFSIGDAVLGVVAEEFGGIAEHAVLAAARTVQKSEQISFADAAVLPVAGATAYDLTHQIELEPGQTMLIIGSGGGVGLMAAQIGRVHKFSVIGVGSASKQQLITSTGAAFILSGEGAAERARAIASDGVDLILDLVGGEVLREFATLVKNPKNIVSAVDAATASDLGGAGLVRTAESLAKITGVVEYGLVDPHVEQQFALVDARTAVAVVESGHATGKVVVTT
ncbi:MAG: NADP-dependent oxidoreductase [Gulosibacter sp.]|uniref:NADP-dependent oxidoreductase n=1 Tax=Gulosibacter sp. TaxID=2817531 RepID=UPI003F8E9BF6